MKVKIAGKHVDISEAFVRKVEDGLDNLCKKFGVEPMDATANLYRVGHGSHHFRIDANLHLGKGVYIRCHGESAEAYSCLNELIHRLTLKLRKHKKRLIDHYRRRDIHLPEPAMAPQYVLSLKGEGEGDDKAKSQDDRHPPIIAEMELEIPKLSVSEAVMRMDLSEEPAFVFLNDAHGQLNVLYRRADGNIGWVDPQLKTT